MPEPPETGNDILIDSDGKKWMQYVVSDLDVGDVDGTRGTMAVNLNASDKTGFVALGLLDESGFMTGSHVVVGIPQCNVIVKYDLMGYADQVALRDEHKTLMDASVEAVDDDKVLKFKKFLV